MSTHPRLLPWLGPSGQRSYLVTDEGGDSYLWQLADEMEAVQLGAGEAVLGHAAEMLNDHKADLGTPVPGAPIV
ncbi:hypothetical protein [Streptomyces sp. L-9-10]|uniref:hypothetical protein n=1 Tax=Streptomyces sp. L-9-10 TaxID=1478131 RepID=UPI0026B26B94